MWTISEDFFLSFLPLPDFLFLFLPSLYYRCLWPIWQGFFSLPDCLYFSVCIFHFTRYKGSFLFYLTSCIFSLHSFLYYSWVFSSLLDFLVSSLPYFLFFFSLSHQYIQESRSWHFSSLPQDQPPGDRRPFPRGDGGAAGLTLFPVAEEDAPA